MTALKRIRERKLKLVEDKMQTARNGIDQAYEKQSAELTAIIEKIFETAPNSKVIIDIFTEIISKVFYNRPSKKAISFVKTIQQFPLDALIEATNDFNVYMSGLPRRTKIQQKLFYTYIKTAQRNKKPKKPILKASDVWGDE